MKSKLLLRIAIAFIFVHLLGHSIGHVGWDKPKDPKMQEVVQAMKGYSGEFMGATKSMADYYNGYSLIMFVVFVMSIFLLWTVSGFIETNRSIAVRILYPMAAAYITLSAIEFVYFFPFAA